MFSLFLCYESFLFFIKKKRIKISTDVGSCTGGWELNWPHFFSSFQILNYCQNFPNVSKNNIFKVWLLKWVFWCISSEESQKICMIYFYWLVAWTFKSHFRNIIVNFVYSHFFMHLEILKTNKPVNLFTAYKDMIEKKFQIKMTR